MRRMKERSEEVLGSASAPAREPPVRKTRKAGSVASNGA